MTKELQDKAWSVLPKDFKEEVKKLYREFAFTREGYYAELFGLHNLISDSKNFSEQKPAEPRFKGNDHVRVISADKYGEDGYIVKVDEEEAGFYYTVAGIEDWRFFEPNLEPYTEPEEESRNLSQETANCDKHFDNILKDSFRNERRLNIATQIMSSILSNQKMLNSLAHGETTADGVVKCIVNASMMYTDALIAECEPTEK